LRDAASGNNELHECGLGPEEVLALIRSSETAQALANSEHLELAFSGHGRRWRLAMPFPDAV
jgi:hypothetical protein